LREHQPQSEDLKLLQLINNVAKGLPERLRHEYFILIDDLDLHWQGTPLQNAFLGTLFYSMRKLSFTTKLKFVVSLRNNIFRQIDLEERDKFSDLVCEVKWQKASVKEMVEKRLHFALNVQLHEVWDGLFEADAFDRIWKQTNGMPREVIRLAIGCVSAAQENGHTTITGEDIDIASRRFSSERLVDLASDCRYLYPGLQQVCKSFCGGKPEFNIERVREVAFELAQLSKASGQEPTWAEVGFEAPLEFAKCLLRCGFLLLKTGRDGKAKEPAPEEVDDIDETNWYAIHPMYAKGQEVHGSK
jgi:hypothetical protein